MASAWPKRTHSGQCSAERGGRRHPPVSPRIVRQLRAQGQPASAERVRRSLQRQGLRPVYKRPYRVTTDSTHRQSVAPNLLDRRFDGWLPNRAWVSDITFIRTGESWLYLAAILDLASRRIVGWSMSERINAGLVCAGTAQRVLATQAGTGAAVTFRPRKSICKPNLPETCRRLQDEHLDEPTRECMG